jgi:integrase
MHNQELSNQELSNKIDEILSIIKIKKVDFLDFAENFIFKKSCSFKTKKQYINYYNQFLLPNFYKKNIDEITFSDIDSLHKKIGKEHKRTANLVLILLSSIFNGAINDGLITFNPCRKVKKFPEQPRERFLSQQELTRFYIAVSQLKIYYKNFFLLLLYTGARKGNIQAMRWQDINLINQIWTIPAKESKNRKTITIHLSENSLILLSEMQKINNNSEFVFSTKKSKSGHLQEPKKVWAKICKNAGLINCHMHDLRATFATYQSILGSDTGVISKTLGHSSEKITKKVYIRSSSELEQNKIKNSVSKVVKYFTAFA